MHLLRIYTAGKRGMKRKRIQASLLFICILSSSHCCDSSTSIFFFQAARAAFTARKIFAERRHWRGEGKKG
jgi:hypothetical protein